MKYSSFIGKKVVLIYEGKVDSYVLDVVIKNKSMSQLLLADIEEETKKVVNKKDIYKIGEDAILIRNANKITQSEPYIKETFIGKSVFDIEGNFLQTVKDIEFDEKFKIIYLATENAQFTLENIISNESAIIIDKNSKHKKHHFKPKVPQIPLSPTSQVVNILETKIPPRISSKNNLIGRKLLKDLVGYNDTLIARKNSIITPHILALAKQHNVLSDLSRFTY